MRQSSTRSRTDRSRACSAVGSTVDRRPHLLAILLIGCTSRAGLSRASASRRSLAEVGIATTRTNHVAPVSPPRVPPAAPLTEATASSGGNPLSTVICTARLFDRVHVRPRADVRSFGPELPGGTEVEVLAIRSNVRRWHGRPNEAVFTRVRDRASGVVGWSFLRFAELSPSCPIVTSHETRNHSVARRRDMSQRLQTRRGTFARRDAPLVCGWMATDSVITHVDLNGDGNQDELLHLSRTNYAVANSCERPIAGLSGEFEGAIAARWRTARGWTTAEFGEQWSGSRGGHSSRRFIDLLRAGAATYLRFEFDTGSVIGYCTRPPISVTDSPPVYQLWRLSPDGEGVMVAFLPPLLGSDCTWEGHDDESIQIRCARPGNRLNLRWDASRFELVAEGSFPDEEEAEPFICSPPG